MDIDGDRAGGRRPADQLEAARCGPDAPRTPRAHRGVGRGSARAARNRGRRHRPARHPDAGDGRLRSLPEDPFQSRNGIPSRRDDHGQRIRTAAGRPRGRCRRLRHQTVRQERAARPGGVAGADQALSRHHPTAGGRAGRMEHRTRVPGRRNRSPSWSATNRLRRFLSPQLADLVIGDETPPRRAIAARSSCSSPICRNFTPFAETSEPEEVMGVLARVSPGHRDAGPRIRRHARAVHRRRDHGVLQRPDPMRRRRRAGGADGVGDPRRRERACRTAGGARVTTSPWESVSPKTSRRSAGSVSKAASTTPPSAASPISPRGCAPTPAPGRYWSPTACSHAIEHMAVAEMVGDVQPKGFSRSVRVHNISATQERR